MLELILIYILNIIDYIETVYAVNNVGFIQEFNPVMQYLLEHNIAWVFKLLFIPIVLAVTHWAVKQLPKAIIVVRICAVWYALVVLHNLATLILFC